MTLLLWALGVYAHYAVFDVAFDGNHALAAGLAAVWPISLPAMWAMIALGL